MKDLIIRIDIGMCGSHGFKGNHTFKIALKKCRTTQKFVGGITRGTFETIREESSTNQCCLGVIIIHIFWNYRVYEINTFAVLLVNRCCEMLVSYSKTKSLLKLLLGKPHLSSL